MVVAAIPPTRPAYVFDGEMWVRNFRSPELLADQVGARVVRPDREDQEEHPGTLFAEAREGRSDRDHRRGESQADDERQQRDVEGPEDRGHPRGETVVRVEAPERGDRDQHDADRAEQQAAALELGRDRGVEDDGQRERDPEGRERLVPGHPEQPEHLEGREGRDDRDGDRQGRATEGKHDEQDRHEHGRGDGSLAHASGPGRQRPNRRWRRANSMRASSNASGPKAGQSRSVK